MLVRARWAVAVLFVLNAAAYANVVPRLPAIKAELGLSNTALGTAVAAMPVGALASGLFAGTLAARWGSGPLAVLCGVGFGAVLPLFAAAPSWAVLAVVFLVLGMLDSLMDVAMNAHALRVQRGYGRSIINGLHGMWSVGAVAGGVIGSAAAGTGVPLGWHLLFAGGGIVTVALLVRRWLLPGRDDDEGRERPAADPLDALVDEGARDRRRASTRRALLLLGLLVVLSAAVEDAPQSWGAVLLREDLGTSAAAAGLVYLAFQSSMTVSRLLGDRLVDRVGDVAVVRAGGMVTAVAVGLGLAVGEPWSVVVGFAAAGWGTAFLFPLAFHAAAEIPGVTTGGGVAVVAWMGRVGFLLAPPLVGAVADATSLRAGLAVVPVAGAAVAVLAGALRPTSCTTRR